ncbi:oxidoreductase, short chain dehydrogenase/reductase family protein [Teladorsagia circumcincta]|uniref:Oxidoreductase, short chain dehydrogenase/reductase family protein n=1 Tax=Teladorsagia circumcincta TaxID=45464 RepID=A0A2G9UCV5_TELCI|nr:oxidoreductase, short chain dehydrogenase/reductase family protein [Teladorsagia circumcincta]
MGRFDNRAVIVTGSSNGIGRATAVLFAKEGAMVTICGRDEKTLNETKSMVLAVNGGDEKKVFLARGDICKEEVMKEIVDGTVKAFGRLDVLNRRALLGVEPAESSHLSTANPAGFQVNNAGGTSSNYEKPGPEGDMSDFEHTLSLNTKSILRLCQLAFPHLVETKGEIVNVSSVAGQPNGASILSAFYSIAKAAQDQLTRNLAIYYIQKGVRVNGVSPGMISTTIASRQGIPVEIVRKAEQKIASSPSRIPCGRAGTPEEIAEAILFLADSPGMISTTIASRQGIPVEIVRKASAADLSLNENAEPLEQWSFYGDNSQCSKCLSEYRTMRSVVFRGTAFATLMLFAQLTPALLCTFIKLQPGNTAYLGETISSQHVSNVGGYLKMCFESQGCVYALFSIISNEY